MENQQGFNPFTDRLSRDIRNNLSTTLLASLAEGTTNPAQRQAEQYLATGLEPHYSDYIHDRLARYQMAVEAISGKIEDPFAKSFILWDLELFFEMHEVLEHEWYHAQGERKALMQALIRAAGFYIKLRHDLAPQARKIGAKALPVLKEQKELLERYIDVEKLLNALSQEQVVPPKLLR